MPDPDDRADPDRSPGGGRLLAIYAATTAGTLLAALLRVALGSYVRGPFLLFLPVCLVAMLVGGLGPGLLALVLSALWAALWILPGGARGAGLSATDLVTLALFLAVGAGLMVVSQVLRRSQARVRELELREAGRRAEARLGETQAALREHRDRLALFIEHAPAAIAMFDREMRYLAASRRYVADYGLPPGEVVGRSHYQIFPEIPERWKAIHRRCLAGAVERCDEDPFPRGDGRTDWVRWEIRPWHDAAGRVGGLLLFSEVITAHKLAMERAAQAERLSATARLVRGMAHELNNPLSSVIANLAFARERLDGAATALAPVSEALHDAESGAERIREVVRDMNAFLPREAAAAVPACDPAEAVRRALERARQPLSACREVAVEVPALPRVALNQEELVQVVAALLANAGQATGPAPNRCRVAGRLAEPDAVELVVSDTGVGMAPEVLARAVEPFFTTRDVGAGKGLGLSVCQAILEAAGGRMSLESRPGQGTSVTVRLPVYGAPPPAAA